METVTTAIVAALGSLGTKTVLDAYEGLKTLIKDKFGEENKVTEAAERLEQEPNSEGWKLLLNEAADKAGADKEPEIIKAAEALLAEVKKQPGGEKIIQNVQNVIGGSSHIFSQSGNVTVTR